MCHVLMTSASEWLLGSSQALLPRCQLLSWFCRKMDCPKNRVYHYEESTTSPDTGEVTTAKKAQLIFCHHKNERKDKGGPATLPVAPEMVEPWVLLEKATSWFAPTCPTLFCASNCQPFTEAYFSINSTRILSLGAVAENRVCANNMRHEFSTAWRNFMDNLQDSAWGGRLGVLEAAAATLMGNTSSSWDAAYDDDVKVRGLNKIISLYAKFREYVKTQHARQVQRRARNPLL